MAEEPPLTTPPPPPSFDPTIDPSTFDLVIVGTGLPESLLAAAAAAAGKSVLHLDPNPFYGSHFSSLPPQSLAPFLHQNLTSPPSPAALPPHHSEFDYVDLGPRGVYTDVEVSGEVPEQARRFLVDVSGPRILYCADPMVDVMLRSGASHHVEFKSVDGTLFYWNGKLITVPDSREAIFKDKTLGLTEKSQMTRFLKLVRGHIASQGEEAEGEGRIPEEDMEIPFAEFLEKQRLPKKIKSIMLYAIAMAEDDQECPDACKRLLKTKEGIESLALYSSSVGRFPNAIGAFIYPIYGQGELPQAFCRCAAVKGALYVLRMSAVSLLISKESRHFKGIRLMSGQDIFCKQLVMDPSFKAVSSDSSDDPNGYLERTNEVNDANSICKVARMICITRNPIQPDLSNVLVVFPPRSLHPEQTTSIRVLQLSSNLAVCSPGLFLLYLSTPCDNVLQGKEYLHAALNSLCTLPDSKETESSARTDIEGVEEDIVWSISYIQDLTQVQNDNLVSCSLPDSSLDYRITLEATMKLFQEMYPQEVFIPESSTDNNEEDGDSLE